MILGYTTLQTPKSTATEAGIGLDVAHAPSGMGGAHRGRLMRQNG
jgi:hypothetical protein